MKPLLEGIQVKDLNHCGIIAGIIDEMGLVEKINQSVGTHYRQKVTPGLAVKAMIINGLGMFSAPLYLFGADLRYASLTGADLSGAIMPDGTVMPENMVLRRSQALELVNNFV